MADMDLDLLKANRITPALRGETIAYALQTGVMNVAANFFEPYISSRVQQRYGGTNQYGSYGQNLAGEFAGDLIGAGTLIVAEAACPDELHHCTRTLRRWVDPVYSVIAEKALAGEKNAPDYARKLEEWKMFQERNLARSTIMATAGLAGNIATQKFLVGNPSPTKFIFLGKLASTLVTTGLGLTVRFVFPEHMKKLDQRIGKRLAPLLQQDTSHVEKLEQENTTPDIPSRG